MLTIKSPDDFREYEGRQIPEGVRWTMAQAIKHGTGKIKVIWSD